MGINSAKRVLATLIAIAVIILAPQPAAAAPGPPGTLLPSGEVVCFFEYRHGFIVGVRCIAVQPLWLDCLKCDVIAIDYGIDPWVHDILVDGFVLLDKAAHATDPGIQAGYRKQARDNFTTVALAISGEVAIGSGFIDRGSGQFVNEPRQRMIDAGAHINAGLAQLTIDPDGDPAVRGMQEMQAAYDLIAGGK